jgi:adenosyl cobinamide kinase/adenosyl cobinamide phosphate guanylyltransferase
VNHVGALNIGVIASPAGSPDRNARAAGRRTIIVTGVARSGTSLIAGLLREAGLFMGDYIYEVVNEDSQILEFLHSGDRGMLRRLIRDRNSSHSNWGFKIPNLHAYLLHQELRLFRNPHLVVITRDPVAVAIRNNLSEHVDQMEALKAAADAMQAMAYFISQARCPTLLLSYEKALAFPNVTIDSLIEFCGLRSPEHVRNKLFAQVQPNRAEYLAAATRHFIGQIDGVLDGQLYGWCAQLGRAEPVRLELMADDVILETVRADRYRDDLAKGGLGNGCHGFFIDLANHRLNAGSVIRMRVANRVLEIENSGRSLGDFPVQSTRV